MHVHSAVFALGTQPCVRVCVCVSMCEARGVNADTELLYGASNGSTSPALVASLTD